MPYPNRARVSPSGTFVNGGTNPFDALAGNVWAAAELGSTDPFPGIIAASGVATFSPSIGLVIGDGPLPANSIHMVPLVAGVPYEKGLYLVELELAVGFDTSPPSTVSNTGVPDSGVLNISAQFTDDAGTPLGDATNIASSPLPKTGVGSYGGFVVHSTKYCITLNVTDAMLAANDGEPPSAILINLVRATGTSGGTYTTTSGTLEISKDTNAKISKIR